MQYIKFTHVDAVTGESVADAPAANGPVYPAVPGLVFGWAAESQYPTAVPELYGTCPDESAVDVPGVLAVLSQAAYDSAHAAELHARHPVPQTVKRSQGKAALIVAGLWDDVLAFVAAISDPTERALAEVALHDTQEWRRDSPFLQRAAEALGMDAEDLDALFLTAEGIEL